MIAVGLHLPGEGISCSEDSALTVGWVGREVAALTDMYMHLQRFFVRCLSLANFN